MKSTEELIIPLTIATFEDKRTGARSIALPFQFPDGKNGALLVTRLWPMPWEPGKTIKSITINYNEDSTGA